MYQDHKAHLTVHLNAIKDPQILKILGQSPQAQSLQAAMQAHVNEHLGFEYRKQIEQQLGMNLPPQEDASGEEVNMDPDVEARLAPLLAEAAQRVLQQNQAQAAQQQAQQQAQDPIIQMQQQELQIKAQEQQRKAAKDQADIQIRQEQIATERQRIAAQTQTEMVKTVAGIEAKKQSAKMEMGLDVLKHMSNQAHGHQTQNKQLYAQGLQSAHALAKNENKPVKKENK
jgi:hypothetical protein